jgi:hypothetical protein
MPALCAALRELQRDRADHLKTRNMLAARLRNIVAGRLGDGCGEAALAAADALISRVAGGEPHALRRLILAHREGIAPLEAVVKDLTREMEALARQLPVWPWKCRPEQRGFGPLALAQVVGECGDLANYPNVAKVWRRMGLAPWSFGGQTRMGSAWRGDKRNRLPPEEWERFGYSPRRRSVAYLIGEALVKQNGGGLYQARYVAAKVKAFRDHPDWAWSNCAKCKGARAFTPVAALVGAAPPCSNGGGAGGDTGCMIEVPIAAPPCPTCGGTGKRCKHADLHGKLLATKLLLKRLWAAWNGRPEEDPPRPTMRDV